MAAIDDFSKNQAGLSSPACNAEAVTPDDDADLVNTTRSIFTGVGGDIVLVTEGGQTVTFVGVITGSILPVRAVRIKATGTTATNMVGLF